MARPVSLSARVIALTIVLVPAAPAAPAVADPQEGTAEPRPAATILREFDSVRYPGMSDGADAESVAKFEREISEAATRQQVLALELATVHPGHERVADVMGSRWILFCTVNGDGEQVLRETDEWVRRLARPDVAIAAAGARALAAITVPDFEFAKRCALAEAALATAPDSVQVAVALTDLAWKFTADPQAQRELAALVREHFAGNDDVLHGLQLVERLGARVGQPLALEFDGVDADRIDGAPKALAEWRGRPCLVNTSFYTPGWVGEHEREARSEFAALRARCPATTLPVLGIVTVFDAAATEAIGRELSPEGDPALWVERASWERSIVREQLGLNQDGAWLLIDAAGVLRAWSWNLAELARHVDRLLAPRRRSI
ncbi:MAG: hypothetical protein FJ293_14575 [Planctomycetes bacterium]|nr:hypothetical protein [Planctomycetota bacterium]